jgi:hypothetical protein
MYASAAKKLIVDDPPIYISKVDATANTNLSANY